MKSILGSVLVALMMSSAAMAAPKYQCIANSLDAVTASERCDQEAAPSIRDKITPQGYQCIADGMDAYNSDLFYNLSSSDIDQMLQDEQSYGHWLAVREAKACGVR